MNYEALFKAANRFKEDPNSYDTCYLEARKSIDWRNLGEVPTGKVKDVVLGFLNKWKCRIPVNDRIANAIKESFLGCAPFLRILGEQKLAEIDFMGTQTILDHTISNRQVIRCIFAVFSDIGQRFSSVAASKTLHMIIPELFMIWDNDIAKNLYKIPKLNSFNYAYEYMPLMQKKANEVIESFMRAQSCNRDDAISEISKRYHGKTLAKLLDEYNWVKAHENQLL